MIDLCLCSLLLRMFTTRQVLQWSPHPGHHGDDKMAPTTALANSYSIQHNHTPGNPTRHRHQSWCLLCLQWLPMIVHQVQRRDRRDRRHSLAQQGATANLDWCLYAENWQRVEGVYPNRSSARRHYQLPSECKYHHTGERAQLAQLDRRYLFKIPTRSPIKTLAPSCDEDDGWWHWARYSLWVVMSQRTAFAFMIRRSGTMWRGGTRPK